MRRSLGNQVGGTPQAEASMALKSWPRRALKKAELLFRGEDGAIAIEFSLLAPILAIALLFLGLAAVRVQRYLDVEQVVSTGIAAAVRDPGQAEVLARLNAAALAKGYTLWTGNSQSIPPDQLFLAAIRQCACPETLQTEQFCTTICMNGRPPVVRYTLSATYGRSAFDTNLAGALARLGRGAGIPDVIIEKQVLIR